MLKPIEAHLGNLLHLVAPQTLLFFGTLPSRELCGGFAFTSNYRG